MLDSIDVSWLRGVGTSLPGLRGRKGAAEGPWVQLEPGLAICVRIGHRCEESQGPSEGIPVEFRRRVLAEAWLRSWHHFSSGVSQPRSGRSS